MTAFLVDTSAYTASKKNHPEVILALQRADRICLSPIVLGELLAGFRRGTRQARNEEQLREFLASNRVDILPLGGETAECYAVILKSLLDAGTPIPTNDTWIAASAMQHGLTLLTTDAHYRKVPQVLVECYDVT